jgi:hypothetical protein
MIAALVAAQALNITFNPPLLFVGESFRFSAPAFNSVTSLKGVALRRRGDEWLGTAKAANAEFWLLREGTDGLEDAAEVRVPMALVPRWKGWPDHSVSMGRLAFLAFGDKRIAAVPMKGNYGLCVFDGRTETRYANAFVLDIAVRSGPRHARDFIPDYFYAGAETIRMSADVDKVAHVSLRITIDAIEVTLVANYAMAGEARILGQQTALNLRQGQKWAGSAPLFSAPVSMPSAR